MTGSLLDTNVVSEVRKQRPDPQVAAFVAMQPIERLFISTVTIVEIRFGIERASGTNRAELDRWLAETVRPMFEGRILHMTEEVLLRWRLLVDAGRKAGRTYSEPDLFLAATALEHDLTLVTRNVRDFIGTGVRTFNPWED